MADRLKEIPAKVLAWWNKFTTRQKSVIIGIGAVVIFTFAILIYIFTKTEFERLLTCNTATEAAEAVDILEGAGIEHRETTDGLIISVPSDRQSDARLALAAAGYKPDEYTLEDALKGSMSTTASDKERYYTEYREKQFESDIASLSAVKSAKVRFNIPPQNGTLVRQQQESTAFIQLELEGTFTSANAANLAKAAATFLGNETTANITIIDFDSNLLFSGGDDYSTAGIANSMQELKNQAESMVANQVKKVLLGTNQFDNIEVTSHLTMDYSNYEETVKEYYANAGRDEGMLAHQSTLDSESESGLSNIPGTDSNVEDNSSYMFENGGNNSSSQTETDSDYLPNESSKYKVTPAGGIDYTNSSMAIAMITYREISEEDAKRQGLLDGITWEEYKAANSADRKLEVDADMYEMAAHATGISADRITLISYESPVFLDKEGMAVSWTNILSIVTFVIILGLLAFVVLRSMRTKNAVEEEEELSVENLLQSTPEDELEDIDVEAKSETRKMIEKFVDDNPEAAAALLRNWLNEDWN